MKRKRKQPDPATRAAYGYPSLAIGNQYFTDSLQGSNLLKEFYPPDPPATPEQLEAQAAADALKLARQKEIQHCMVLGIPVPKMHGPANRKRVGVALRFAIASVNDGRCRECGHHQ